MLYKHFTVNTGWMLMQSNYRYPFTFSLSPCYWMLSATINTTKFSEQILYLLLNLKFMGNNLKQ